MNIIDYVKTNTKEERQEHVDLTTPCEWAYALKSYKDLEKGEMLKNPHAQKGRARKNLMDFLGLTGSGGYSIHACHICKNNSATGKVCVNPQHMYIGTASENNFDIQLEKRQIKALKSCMKAFRSGKHNSMQYTDCKYCNRSIKGPSIGVHEAACKRNLIKSLEAQIEELKAS